MEAAAGPVALAQKGVEPSEESPLQEPLPGYSFAVAAPEPQPSEAALPPSASVASSRTAHSEAGEGCGTSFRVPTSVSRREGLDVAPVSRSPSLISGKAGRSAVLAVELPPAGPVETFLSWCCVGCLRKVFSRTRWHYLFFISLYAFFIGPLYLNWAPLRQVLFKSGAYKWECDPEEADPTSLRYIHPDHDTCVEQRLRVGHLFTVCAAADYGFSFFGGLAMDMLGPKIASLLGSSSMLAGWLLLSVSSESVQMLIPGFALFGLGIDMAFYGTLSVAALFPGHENAIMAIVVAMRALSYMTPVVLDSLTSALPYIAVMLGFALLCLLPAVIIAFIYAPWKPFPKSAHTAALTAEEHARLSCSLDVVSSAPRRSSVGLQCATCGRPILAAESEGLDRPDRSDAPHHGEERSTLDDDQAIRRPRTSGSSCLDYASISHRASALSGGLLPLRCRACRGSGSVGFPEGGLYGELSADFTEEQRQLEHQLGQLPGRGAAAEGALAAALVAVRLISGESGLPDPPAVLGESREDRGRRAREREEERRASASDIFRVYSPREARHEGTGAPAGPRDGEGADKDHGLASRLEVKSADATPRGPLHAASGGEPAGGAGSGSGSGFLPELSPPLGLGEREKPSSGEASACGGKAREDRSGLASSGLASVSSQRVESLARTHASAGAHRASQDGADARRERSSAGGEGRGAPVHSVSSPYSMASARSRCDEEIRRAPSMRQYPNTCLGRLRFFRDTLRAHPYVVDSLAFTRDFILSPMYVPLVPYFTIALIRAIYFNDASEDLVPNSLRFLHIILGFVFVAPPFAGVIADYFGIIVCMVLINTCGTLVVVAALIAYEVHVVFFEYCASFMFMLNMALMTNQVYFYVADTFPQRHLGKLCGFACTIGGVLSLCVTPMFEFSVKTAGGFTIMLSLLVGLSVITYILIGLLQCTASRNQAKNKAEGALGPGGFGGDAGAGRRRLHTPGGESQPTTSRDSATAARRRLTDDDLSIHARPEASLSATYGLASDFV
ncbi:hypothetical protein BESB_004880 [Besnoitia besnoiti]|uniref:Transmembrane protein n=1 Tax=Besnoitia besnoiti TaxID=94643 RepID=A0A2A9MPW6_BESBE|nr:hypothetical protein BESB_004880 [Besnoitia besnoiti]PFH38147.1 hypothetical protein BESB_004880 [Besnoitia besnoiti]